MKTQYFTVSNKLYIYTYISRRLRVYFWNNIYVYVFVYIYIYTYIYIYIYIIILCTYIYIYIYQVGSERMKFDFDAIIGQDGSQALFLFFIIDYYLLFITYYWLLLLIIIIYYLLFIIIHNRGRPHAGAFCLWMPL